MAKGRRFVPSADRVGIWFSGRYGGMAVDKGQFNAAGTTRGELTTTGNMLSTPHTCDGTFLPQPAPPPTFSYKARSSFQTSNPFSEHDNRNTIQGRGEYFGNGKDTRILGRKLIRPIQARLHHTEGDFLKHYSHTPFHDNYATEFSASYIGRPTSCPPSTRRRFPRARPVPRSGPVRLSTTTTDWFNDIPDNQASSHIPTGVLAVSQRHFPKSNKWKYSYKGLHRVYPPFHNPSKVSKGADNVFNRCEAAFTKRVES